MLLSGDRRPSKKQAMLTALAKTGNVSAAARAADIDRATHYKWLQSDPDYAARVEQAMEEAVDVLEAAARRRALLGSDTLLIFLLKGLRPEKYRERHHVHHEAKVEVEHEISLAEILSDRAVAVALQDAAVRQYHERRQPGGEHRRSELGPRN